MYRKNSALLAPAALALAASLLAGCASDNFFADDDMYVSNSGSRLHPIKVVNGRAKVEECGVWPDDLGDSSRNEIAANHGCAVQNNIAAMAAQPRDLIGKNRPLPPPLGDVQYTAVRKLSGPASGGSQ